MENKVIELAKAVISRAPGHRPEAEWIQQQAQRLAQREGIRRRAEMDQQIFERMYARVPKNTETVKIRYWRTGHHLPSGREEALMFARALQLDERDTVYLLQACMEKSDVVFEKVPEPESPFAVLYKERTSLMEEMISEYIDQIPPGRINQLNIPYERLSAYARHLYCIDALHATALYTSAGRQQMIRSHFSSNNFEAEFIRFRRLLGEIPRRTILRHIFLLGIPYLNRRLVDDRLRRLGYLPLTEGHTSPGGAKVDDLVIGFLELYGESCTGQDPLMCRQWMFEQLGILDRYLKDAGREEYRFLYFRGLSAMLEGVERECISL